MSKETAIKLAGKLRDVEGVMNDIAQGDAHTHLSIGWVPIDFPQECLVEALKRIDHIDSPGPRQEHKGNDAPKRKALFETFKKLAAHIILLQETKCNPKDVNNWSNEWDIGPSIFNAANRKKHANAGTAILINHPTITFAQTRRDAEGGDFNMVGDDPERDRSLSTKSEVVERK
ncbi:unnamed protein product [Clavelina lepadiformis]|uniref:Endonuclease/exonuclease/phosphatase domain-containing protein n=1 Tax=Clavelina lepadiformis TaxID=159417 RepID=A0ABP0G2M2_CLALP